MFDRLYFEYPSVGLLILLFIFCAVFCKMKLPSLYFPQTAKFAKTSLGKSRLLLFLKWLSILMLIVTLMSPVVDEPYELEPKDGYEIALVIDASQSMQAKGFDKSDGSLSRFEVVKNIVSDFITSRKNDNMGIIVFGSYSFVAAPLTYDVSILRSIVSNLYIGMAGEFTVLYEAVAQGVKLLEKSESKTKIIILLTDGYNTPDSKFPFEVAVDLAKKQGVKVYPIGIGGPKEYNKKMLNKIAKQTGGVAFSAVDAEELAKVYDKINQLEKSEIANETFNFLKYYYKIPLLISFFF